MSRSLKINNATNIARRVNFYDAWKTYIYVFTHRVNFVILFIALLRCTQTPCKTKVCIICVHYECETRMVSFHITRSTRVRRPAKRKLFICPRGARPRRNFAPNHASRQHNIIYNQRRRQSSPCSTLRNNGRKLNAGLDFALYALQQPVFEQVKNFKARLNLYHKVKQRVN